MGRAFILYKIVQLCVTWKCGCNFVHLTYSICLFQADTVGDYAGRISMTNSRQLIIENMQVQDGGSFECEITSAPRTYVPPIEDVPLLSV